MSAIYYEKLHCKLAKLDDTEQALAAEYDNYKNMLSICNQPPHKKQRVRLVKLYTSIIARRNNLWTARQALLAALD